MTEQPAVDISGCHRLYMCNERKLSVSFSQKPVLDCPWI